MKKCISAILALVLALAACGTAAAEHEARKMETAADADEFAAVFLGEHPEELEGVWAMTPQMEAALARMGGMAGLAKSLDSLGTVAEIAPAYEGTLQGYRTFGIPCVFSAMSVDLVLVVQDGAVAGLQIGEYSGGPKEEQTESALFDSVELPLPVPELGELPGVLTVPRGDGPFPAVVLLQGSGPSDRDGSVGNLKPFRDIAEGLAAQGVAVYRFDKRTYAYARQLMTQTDFTPEDEYLQDAVNAVRLLAEQDKIDSGRVWVLGHSLGGNLIPAVARELKKGPVKARGFIMMAASPRPLDVLMREQYDFLYSLMPEITAEQQAEKDAVFAQLDRLQDPDSLSGDESILGAYPAYWKWLAEYDALQAAGEISEPVLLLQGEEDYQVTMEDFGIWKEAFGEKENWRLVSCPGLTHPFTAGQKTEGAAAYSRSGSVDARVIQDIADFIVQDGANP